MKAKNTISNCSATPLAESSASSSATPLAPLLAVTRFCVICSEKANGHNYGVLTCDACKMFFNRAITLNQRCFERKCQPDASCARGEVMKTKCKYCRFNHCLIEGMNFYCTRINIKEIKKPKLYNILRGIPDLISKDEIRYFECVNSYSAADPSLEDVLRDRTSMRLVNKPYTKFHISPHEWTFLDVFSRVRFFTQFSFMDQLTTHEKKILFSFNTVKVAMLGKAMRTMLQGRSSMITPNGDEVYPEEIYRMFPDTSRLERICSSIVGKVIELKMTQEEHILMTFILFCEPNVSNTFSTHARTTLLAEKTLFENRLIGFCQHHYEQSYPARLSELFSICHILYQVQDDLQVLSMFFRIQVPQFPFKKLVADTFAHPGIGLDDPTEKNEYLQRQQM